MKELLTPKQVSRAINVSESSVKRWCDKGVIPTQYTAGGHRRIPIQNLIEFLRASKYELVRPQVLGLPSNIGQSKRSVDRAAEQLSESLLSGDEESSRQVVFDLYLAEHGVASICDDVIRAAFEKVGDRWECGSSEVYQERRGCEIALRILHELRAIVPTPEEAAPVAIGGAIEGDQYILGTTMAELILRDSRWNAVSLGANLPFHTLAAAIKENRPRLFWLSCSHISDTEKFISGYNELFEEFGMEVAFVVGGQGLVPELRNRMQYAAYCDSMKHLESFAQTLSSAFEKQ